ncbi:insulinase family protein [Flammeovirga sp. MY04]|uniref:M16 family metallopeptidase n=1 Tax=Flammeovirga sp. MY04 TaxID=1191459 RepID=UPI0008060A0E|nr:insulinase family protein [Flammeovirga sp. MY04]ANQ51357.1 insulinase family protein [Flammeovirga sp. MY04]
MTYKSILASVLMSGALLLGGNSTQAQEKSELEYKTVPNDPLKTRIYTLDNGLKVYLSEYKDAPRIQTYIAVKAGGKNDPANATGLAHYLEHIMFKGTSHFGTLDWDTEKVYLDSIENMFEHYRTLTDPEERTAYYKKIDQVSNDASKYSIANEYDRMIGMIGAKGTNAYTSNDRTVYVNDIPANELERWLEIEGDRFREIVPRLFHTELEAVYEEKNRSLDNDQRKVFTAMFESMFPNHPYGTQTVIGTIDHLKNPSITEIKKYFNTYYRPNNVAICLSGDLDPDKTIALIQKYFGDWKPGDIPEFTYNEEKPITAPIEKEVFGPQTGMVFLGYRMPGLASDSRDLLKEQLCDMILANSAAGLIDLDLNQTQKVVNASSFVYPFNDYTVHCLYAIPRQDQTLEQAKDLLLAEMDKLKKGEFEDWLLEAIVNDFKKSEIKKLESNSARADAFVQAFTRDIKWENYIDDIEVMKTITKEEIVKFANERYKDNYVVVYKRVGEDPNKIQVDKPSITKVELNRGKTSKFFDNIASQKPAKLTPMFLDYEKDIQEGKLKRKVVVRYKQNVENDLFNLYYIIPVGKDTDPTLSQAVQYLEFLGTDKMSSPEIKQEFYKLGASFSVNSSADQVYVSLSGLTENMVASIRLFEDLLNNAKADEAALKNMIANEKKSREDTQKNKGAILFTGLMNYGLYGADNPVTNGLSNKELDLLTPEKLVNKIHQLTKMEHHILYYGPESLKSVVATLNKEHVVPKKLQAVPAEKEFMINDIDKPKVYWAHYDMVQAEVLFLAKGDVYDPQRIAAATLFNEYFGGSMNAIVFQEMREAQGLAYSVFSKYGVASEKNKHDYTLAYIGTQSDKLKEAMAGMMKLLENPPKNEQSFDAAKKAVLSKLESERITKSSVLFNYEAALKKGNDHDIRKDIYEAVQTLTIDDVMKFHDDFIKGKHYNICVVGDEEKLDMETLKSYGELKELSLNDIFGFDNEPRDAQ